MRYKTIAASLISLTVSFLCTNANGQITPDTSHFVRRIEVVPNGIIVLNGDTNFRSISRLTYSNGVLYSYQNDFNIQQQITQLSVYTSADTGRTWKTLSVIDSDSFSDGCVD